MCPRPSLQVSPAAELMEALFGLIFGRMTLPSCAPPDPGGELKCRAVARPGTALQCMVSCAVHEGMHIQQHEQSVGCSCNCREPYALYPPCW